MFYSNFRFSFSFRQNLQNSPPEKRCFVRSGGVLFCFYIEMCYWKIKSDLQDGRLLRSKQPDLVYLEYGGVDCV